MLSLIAVVFFMSWSLTWCARRYALAKQILDIPNQRSSHRIPTPRGGGIAFIFVFMSAVLCLNYLEIIHWSGCTTILSTSAFIALLGFWDDKHSLPAWVRFLGHIGAGALALYGIGVIPPIHLYHSILCPNWIANIFIVSYLVWMLNLYNFMDGIDGLASMEGISACLSMGFLYWLTGHHANMLLPLLLATSLTGFLFWNFPPARIFMGDIGSGFLGFIIGVLSLQSIHLQANFFWCWLIVLGVFIVDATVTLFCRFIQGEKIYLAHHNHGYQHASRLFNNHISVTLGVLAINLLWLFPIALMVGLGYMSGALGVLIAYLPLVILAIRFNAGFK